MFERLVVTLFTANFDFSKPGRFWRNLVLLELFGLLATIFWLVAPFAAWSSLGPGWVLLWLLPTSWAVFTMARSRHSAGVG